MSYQLKYCVWELTLKCNMHCMHCGSSAGYERDSELTLDECFKVAGQLKALQCKNVCLIGGEVLLRKDWYLIAGRLVSYGIHTNIITNGYGLGREELNQIKKSGIKSVCVSIDGCGKTHNLIRRADSFRDCINTVRILKNFGYRVSVLTTLNSLNVNELEDLYRVLLQNKVDLWQLQLCAPFGNAKGKSEMLVSKEQLKFIMQFIVRKRKEGLIQIGAADNIGYYTEEEPYLRTSIGEIGCFMGCNAGIDTIGIDSAGNIRGCESLNDEKFIEGNIRVNTLQEIWSSKKAFSYNRQFKESMLEGKCSACDSRQFCAGGCRSMNYFGHGKLYEAYICAKAENY